MNKNGYNLALCGYGAIGKGVVKIVNSLPSSLNIKMTKVLDKEEKREEQFGIYDVARGNTSI